MARKIIDIGAVGNDGTGDSIRDSFNKVNDNFLELYSSLGLGERLKFTGLSDVPSSYIGQEGAVLTVNQTTTGLKFKQIVPGVGISIDQITNPNEIKVNAIFSQISADKAPQLGGDLSAISGGNHYRIKDLQQPIYPSEAVNKAYADTKISRYGVDAIDPETGLNNQAFGRMTGPLILSRSPQPDDDIVYDGLIAATKSYVDNAAFGSIANLYVATSGADARPGVSDELQGRALAYAYRTIEAAMKRAEELILESRVEIGPYKKTLTYNGGAGTCTLSNISTSSDSGSGFVGAALMSVDTVILSGPGANYNVNDIITLSGGTVAPGGQAAKIQVLSTASTPGAVVTFKIISSGVYTVVPGNLAIPTTSNSAYGLGARFDVTYKVNNVSVSNPGTNYGLVSVRITGSGGAGAFGTANVVGGGIQSVTVTDPGSGFTGTPTVVADLPTFAIYTAGKGTDFTGNYSTNTLTAAATRDIRPGLYLRGETSGALAQILTHTGYIDSQGNELFDVDIKYGSFVIGEAISYGDVTKNTQVAVLVESGIYEENYPIKIPQNVALIGDEFRRTIIKPRSGSSSSPWSLQTFRRDSTIDGITTSTQLFGHHYLTDPSQPVYPPVNNAGNYKAAAQLLSLNKTFIQEELIAWIDYQISHRIEPFDGSFSFNSSQFTTNIGLILDAVTDDMVFGSNYRSTDIGVMYLRSYNLSVTTTQKHQIIAGINKARDLALNTIYGSSTYVTSATLIKQNFARVTGIINALAAPNDTLTYTKPSGVNSDVSAAATILQANRTFIQYEISSYVSENLGTITNYDAATWRQGVGYIIDAMTYDLLYGGTARSIKDGLAYYDPSGIITIPGQTAAFASTIAQLKIIIPQVISNSTTWANKASTNTQSQVTNLTAASSSGVSATKLVALLEIIRDIVANGPTATSAQTPTYASYSSGINATLNTDRTNIIAAKSTISAGVISYINATYSPGTFTYNSKLCKRDAGLIVDALIFDLRYGGYDRTISAALKYYQSASALKAITDQLDETVAAMNKIINLAQYVIANATPSTLYQQNVFQIIDQAYIAESGTGSIITNLVNAIIDIISGSVSLNLPKDNNKLDVFLCNDAVMVRKVTAQGHGGFMMVLDPQGQILAKSPYCQESASFIGSTGRKQFAGGMFVDGFAGNSEFRMSSAASTTKISVTGLQRYPNLPASVIISDSVYRVNYIRDYVYGLPNAFVYDQAKCSRDVGLIVNAVLDDIIFNTNYRSITAALSYLRSYSSVVTTQQKVQTIAGINRARDLVLSYITNPTEITLITTLMGVITTIISAGTPTAAPALTFTNPNNVLAGITTGAAELINNRQFLIDEVIAYINANLTPGSIDQYSEATCRRDTGYFIDAMTFDLLYGGNTATVLAADAYYNGSTNTIATEQTQVAAAFTRLQSIIGNVITASTGWTKSPGNSTVQSTSAGAGSSTASSTVSALVGYVISIINGGVAANPATVNPTYANGNRYSTYSADRTTILAGLSDVQANVIKFLNATYGTGGSSATMVLDPSTPYTFDVGPQTCTISNGSPAVVTKLNHNLQAGATITFSTTGSLPGGLVAGKRYYVLLAGIGANTFSFTDTIGSIVPVVTTTNGSGIHLYDRVYELLMPGNRSMLSNDYTQIADLGYGVIVTNGGLTEAVSMFTYYCQISYYSINGGQIRSIAGSSAHGLYALVAEGSDPLEVPTPTDLYYNLSQAVTCYYPSGNYSNSTQGVVIYITNYSYVPLPNSELEVDHGSGILYRYPVNSAYTGSDLPNGVARLTLGSTTGATGLSGLYASVSDGTIMTVRQSQSLMLTGNLAGVTVRPSTGLVFTESATNVYRVLQFTDYSDPSAPYTCTISNASPAVITRSNHGLLANYTITFSTSGTLPTGITAGQTYYVLGTGLTQNTFQISLLKGGGAINTSSAGSGTFYYTPTGVTTTLLRENYSYIYLTVYQPNDYSYIATTSTTSTVTTATMTNSFINGYTLTARTVSAGTVTNGMVLSGGSILAGTYIASTNTGTINSATIASTILSTTGTVGSITGTGPWTATITGMSATTGFVVGAPLTATSGTGTLYGGSPTSVVVASIVSSTSITYTVTGGTTPTAGTVTNVSSTVLTGASGTTGLTVGGVLSGGAVTAATYILGQITSTATASVVATFTGTSGQNTITLSTFTTGTINSVVVGQFVSPISGIPANTYVTAVNTGTSVITISNTLVGAVSGSSSLFTAGTSGTYALSNAATGTPTTSTSYNVSVSQTQTATTITGTSYPITASSSISNAAVNQPVTFGITTQATASDALTNYITVGTTTGMVANMPLIFTVSGGSAFGGLVASTTYYVSQIVSGTQITVSNSQGGAVRSVTTGAGSMIVTTGGTFGGFSAGVSYYLSAVTSSNTFTISPYQQIATTATATNITTASLPLSTIAGTTLTVGTGSSGTITPGMVLSGSGVTSGTYIISNISGVGDGSKWLVSASQTVASTTITATGYLVTLGTTTGMAIGQPIIFTGTAIGSLVSLTRYYIAAIADSTRVAISASSALSSLVTLTNATGTMTALATFTQQVLTAASSQSISTIISGGVPATVTTSSTTAIFTTTFAHGLVAGDVIKVSSTGTLATGLVSNAHYFVISTNLTSTTFSISLSPGGTAVLTSGTPTGTMYFGKVVGRAGDSSVAVVALGPYDRARAAGSVFNWKGIDYIITRYDPETVTNTAFGRIFVSQINLTTGVQNGLGFNDSVVSYVSSVTLKASVRRGTTNANGTLTIRIALTRVTGHDLLDIGTGSYADTNYPNEIYGPAVNARNPAGETVERTVGRVFYVTTDQYGNFRVGPYFSVDQGTGKVSFSAAIALSNLDGLGFKRGVPISEFSTDSAFTNNATDTVPTQNATRIYIERRLGLTHNGAAVDPSQLIPVTTGGFLALNGSLKMKGNADFNQNKIVNLANPTDAQDAVNLRSMTFANFQDFSASGIAASQILAFTGSGFGAQNATMSGDVNLSLNAATHVITATVTSGAIVNSKVSATAAIDQSKLNMNAAVTRTNATGITQANLGVAAFDDTQFVASSGWITLKDNGTPFGKIQQTGSNTVLGNSTISTANVASVAFTTVVDSGGAIKKNQYGSTGFLRRTNSSVSAGGSDGDYAIVEMSAAYTGTGDNGKLINRDSSGNFAANIANLSQLQIDSNLAIDTATAASGGYVRYYGWNSVGGLLIQSGTNAADNKSLYWNDAHNFKTKDGTTDAPITASQIQVQAITTGGNTTSGTITGRWTLTGSSPNESRLQSTYSADLAEYYEGDKEYEVGSVLVFGGDKEVTVSGKLANTRVAGVVSNTAAVAMYEACPGFKNLVALQGRVPVKVVGKIQKGDLLVTSTIPGVAISAGEDAKTGTVIGKALETYDSDHIGTIEVAVGRS